MSRFYGKKVDGNHGAIRQDFRLAGWEWEDLHRLPKTCDGLVESPKGVLYLIEVKRLEGKRNPKASTNAKAETKANQKRFAERFHVHVITSVEQAKAWREERS